VIVQNALPDADIDGAFPIQPGGIVQLGFPYGDVKVSGLSVEEAKDAITQQIQKQARNPIVDVALVQTMAQQQIAGEHLVGPDGSVTLGNYGSVRVVGQSIAEATATIEDHLSQFLDDPEISIDVFAYNSKKYYVFTQGAGLGDRLISLPFTGNETVLDAISQINGLEATASKRIWVARPTADPCVAQIMPVDWRSITAEGSVATNYQVLPGDRIFVAEDKMVAFDTWVGKVIAPWERIMGFSLLGVQTATRFSGAVLQGGGNPRGFGGGF
jgi:polysaccharide export outer membrane protein